jgi:hypothetical protein
MTGFAAPARGQHHRLLKTPKTKVTEGRTKSKQEFGLGAVSSHSNTASTTIPIET